MGNVRYLRLERIKTGSFLTVELPWSMTLGNACLWAEINLGPQWEVINGCLTNPDFE